MNTSLRIGPLLIESGELVALRLFDVAYAIDLAHAQRRLAEHLGEAGSRARLRTTPDKALAFGVPPLELTLRTVDVALGAESAQGVVTARLYDFGVIVLALRVAVAGVSWSEFSARFNALDASVGADAANTPWAQWLAEVRAIIAPALERPGTSSIEEDYLFGVVHALDRPRSANELRDEADLVGLLGGETRPLSEGAARDLLQRSFSYYADDLVVLTWDRAFVYEPRGDSDVMNVIEVANAQLVELRYYDELLDAELPLMYDRVERARRAASLFASRRFAHLARRLYTLVAEVTELTEKVDNALQVTEDVYLARVYSAALEQFRVPNVGAAVDRKLAIIRDTYTALYDEASSRRAEILEIAIVLLIVIEIVLALVGH